MHLIILFFIKVLNLKKKYTYELDCSFRLTEFFFSLYSSLGQRNSNDFNEFLIFSYYFCQMVHAYYRIFAGLPLLQDLP